MPLRRSSVPSIDVRTAAARRESHRAAIVDVRELDEWAAGHIPGALHVPLADLRARAAEFVSHPALYVICRTGNRSERGARLLRDAGLEALNVDGGMRAWQKAALPLDPPEGSVT